MMLHRDGVGGRRDDGGVNPAIGADGAEQVGRLPPVVADHGETEAYQRRDIGARALLPQAGFVVEPDLDRRAGGAAEQSLF